MYIVKTNAGFSAFLDVRFDYDYAMTFIKEFPV